MSRRWFVAVASLVLVAGCSSGSNHSKAAGTPGAGSSSAAATPEAAASPTGSAGSATPSAAATAPSVNVCSSGQLRLSVGSTDGGAGQFHQQLVLTNRGAACSLHGYPGVSFLDNGGRLIGDPAAMTPATVSRVQLRTGGRAVAILTYSNAGAFDEQRCKPRQSRTVRVYPPGQRLALIAPDSVLVCSATGTGQLRIDPVTPR